MPLIVNCTRATREPANNVRLVLCRKSLEYHSVNPYSNNNNELIHYVCRMETLYLLCVCICVRACTRVQSG